MRSLTVGMPCHDTFKAHTVASLIQLIGSQQVPVRTDIAKGTFVHHQREVLVERAIEAGSSHLLFIDTDMVFPPDTAQKLAALEKPIVGVGANEKRLPRVSTVKLLDQEPGTTAVQPTDEPFECRAVGAGVMLVDLEQVKDLPRPWFDVGRDDQGVVGEDVFFCEHARTHGLEVWCDPTIEVGHLGDFLF